MQAELTKPSLATPEHPVEISGSQAVLEAFIAEGVDTIFGYPVVLLCLFMMHSMIITTGSNIF